MNWWRCFANEASGNAVLKRRDAILTSSLIIAVSMNLNLLPSLGQSALAEGAAKSTTKTTTKAAAKSASAASSNKADAAKGSAKSGKPQVIEFSASWCAPCKVFAPVYEKVKAQYSSKADFQSLDFDDDKNKKTVEKYHIDSLPSVVVLTGTGKVSYNHSGLLDEKTLSSEVAKVVGK